MNGRVKASPLARKIAREHDVDLQTVTGSGPFGRIVQKDILAAAAAPQAAKAKPPATPVRAYLPGGDRGEIRQRRQWRKFPL